MNEVLFSKTDLGNYILVAMAKGDDEEEEVLMMHDVSRDLTQIPYSIKVTIESNDEDPQTDGDIGLFEGFQEFMRQCEQDHISLGSNVEFKDLLLPYWCKIQCFSFRI